MAERLDRKEIEQKIQERAAWDKEFRQSLRADPKKTLGEFLGVDVPEDVQVKLVEEQPRTFFVVLPYMPADAPAEKQLSSEELEAVAGGKGSSSWSSSYASCGFWC
jgi:hypothetical protein